MNPPGRRSGAASTSRVPGRIRAPEAEARQGIAPDARSTRRDEPGPPSPRAREGSGPPATPCLSEGREQVGEGIVQVPDGRRLYSTHSASPDDFAGTLAAAPQPTSDIKVTDIDREARREKTPEVIAKRLPKRPTQRPEGQPAQIGYWGITADCRGFDQWIPWRP